jgi:hypothetical protein
MDVDDRVELAHRGQEKNLVWKLERRGGLAKGILSLTGRKGRVGVALRAAPGNQVRVQKTGANLEYIGSWQVSF